MALTPSTSRADPTSSSADVPKYHGENKTWYKLLAFRSYWQSCRLRSKQQYPPSPRTFFSVLLHTQKLMGNSPTRRLSWLRDEICSSWYFLIKTRVPGFTSSEYEALGRERNEESCPEDGKVRPESLSMKAPMDLRVKGKQREAEM